MPLATNRVDIIEPQNNRDHVFYLQNKATVEVLVDHKAGLVAPEQIKAPPIDNAL